MSKIFHNFGKFSAITSLNNLPTFLSFYIFLPLFSSGNLIMNKLLLSLVSYSLCWLSSLFFILLPLVFLWIIYNDLSSASQSLCSVLSSVLLLTVVFFILLIIFFSSRICIWYFLTAIPLLNSFG